MSEHQIGARTHPFWRALGHQLRCPSGIRGRAIGSILDIVNAGPLRAALTELKPDANADVLEIGFGSGRSIVHLLRRNPQLAYCGIDQSPDMVRLASRRHAQAIEDGRVQLVCGRSDRVPWDDAAFDRALAINVAYFFYRDGRDIREIHRVLKPGGRLVLYVTDHATMQRWPFVTPATHSTFDVSSLMQLLRNGGFEETQIRIESVRLPGGHGLLGIGSKSACP